MSASIDFLICLNFIKKILSRREIPAAGLPSGAAQVTGDEAGEAERDLRLLHGQDVRGAGQHQLLLQLPPLLLPDVPEQLPESLLRHAAAAVHGGVLLLQPGLRGALRQVGPGTTPDIHLVPNE